MSKIHAGIAGALIGGTIVGPGIFVVLIYLFHPQIKTGEEFQWAVLGSPIGLAAGFAVGWLLASRRGKL